MNQERIKELASQARKYADDNEEHWKSGSGRDWDSLFEQKFAELIVRECAKAVEYSIWHLPRGYKAVDQAAFVKKHFGVEE